ncbi:MAG: cytochrome c biogenesis protein CcdA [Propionibacteriales bacterium]|nr:cytochrome c biogenesis protein CcdA [Propionibacteriales bacterium]
MSASPTASIGSWFESTAFDGPMLLAIPVALLAGAVSFFSPCVLPLLPGYLSYVTGLSGADIVAKGSSGVRGRMVTGTLLFILGFSFVFVAVGGAFGQVGYWLVDHQASLMRVLGVLTIVLGLVFAGAVPWLQRDVRIHRVPAVGLGAAPLLGVLFGLGWTPCIGPTLGAVLSLSGLGGSPTRGAFLAFVYCLGLGLPFLAAAVSYRKMMGAVGWVRRHQMWVMRLGGGMLVVVGVLLVTGIWNSVIIDMKTWVGSFETVI